MKRCIRILMILSIFFSVLPSAFAENNSYTPEAILAFANWLFEQGEYARAAGEYYRYLYAAGKEGTDVMLRKIGTCYFRALEYRKAIEVYERLFKEYPGSPLIEEAYYESAYCFFKLGEYNSSAARIEQFGLSRELSPTFLLLGGANFLLAGEWDRAASILNQYLLLPTAGDKEKASELKALTESIYNLPVRSPVLAGLLSVFIPGLGKLYAGRTLDGLTSFLLIGFLGGMAAYSFVSEGAESVKGWLYTSIGGLLYLGDLWGSVVAAEQFNTEQRDEVNRKVRSGVEALFP